MNNDNRAWCRDNWSKVPEEQRKKCTDHLVACLPQSLLLFWKTNGFPSYFHFYSGVTVRDILRQVMADDELPPISYADGPSCNWDDYYTGALDEVLESIA